MKINNYSSLASTPLRKKALDILIEGVKSALPSNFIAEQVRFDNDILIVQKDSYRLGNGRIFVLGGGKASGLMAQALESVIPIEKIHSGFVNAQFKVPTKKIIVNESGFPLPDQRGVDGVKKMLAQLTDLKDEDVVICLISGGGSALLPYPADGITLEDKQEVNRILLECGSDHYEINIVRKHLSEIKGGKLAKLLAPARVVTLILSDDFGGKGDVASGPTSCDESTFKEAYNIIEKYHAVDKMPKNVIDHIKKGIIGKVSGNVSKKDPVWKNVHNYTLADNKVSLASMEKKAIELGLKVHNINEVFHGNIDDLVKKMQKIFEKTYNSEDKPIAIIFSSETHIALKSPGKGGRNQHFVASLIKSLSGRKNSVVASIDSDGVDFVKGVAGAIIDDKTYDLAQEKRISIDEYINDNKTFFLHEKLGTLIFAEPTGTNVGDLAIYLQEK